MAMTSTSAARATMVAGIAERSVGTTAVTSSSFLGRSVCVPRAVLPARRVRTQSIRAETRSPADAAKQGLKEGAEGAKQLGREGGSEAKARVDEATKDFGSSVQNTTNEMQRAGKDIAGNLKKEAKDVTDPAGDFLKKTRQEGREANSEVAEKYEDPKKFNLGAEIEGSAGQALVDNTEKAKRTASKAGNAVSESAQSQGKEFVDNVSKGFSEAGDRLKGAVKDTVQDTKEFFDADGAKQRVKEGQDLIGKNADSAKKHAQEGLDK
eukprot:TRINITY_DN16231_c0_g1_i1.p1 TRINITY_DN16231_c0_g1~~TRINITY_DN16231_c0_g1_i1.p1  ORF type:complete len:266 (+),score=87.12 TRINITY_DN16231_c0_g1_i1:320-1117(+)